ncbi:PepSY-associated TM helix domain-containing protein [Haloferula sargassicola]|uniref:Peptidase n=1 Tax=Haloferula sargassicola TaxID=490096 RepID=A0ABP9UNC9_9BACT
MRRGFRYWLLTIHRDCGYFFAGMVIVFALSGVALNHRDDWNPSFMVERREIQADLPQDRSELDRELLQAVLAEAGIDDRYRTHDFPSAAKLKVFTEAGSALINLRTGEGEYEALRRRPVFYQVNFLHLNPRGWWKYYSDLFSLALIAVTLSGLFLARGRFGFRWRGAILGLLGLVAPLVFLGMG